MDHGHGTSVVRVCLFVILHHSIFQLYHGNDMIYEMKEEEKAEPTLLLTQGIFTLPQPHGHGMRGIGL